MIKWKEGKKIPAKFRRKKSGHDRKQGRDTLPNAEKDFLSERYLSRIGVCSLSNVGMPRNAKTHDTRELLRTNRTWRPACWTITHFTQCHRVRSYGSKSACNQCQDTAFKCYWPQGPVSPSSIFCNQAHCHENRRCLIMAAAFPTKAKEFARFEMPAPYLCLTWCP